MQFIKRFRVGQRAIKTAISVGLALALAMVLGSSLPIFAAIGAISVMSRTWVDSLKESLNQIAGTFLGYLIACVFVTVLPNPTFFVWMALGVLCVISLCIGLKLNFAIPLASIVFADVCLYTGGDSIVYGFHRFTDTLVGLVVALLVTQFVAFPCSIIYGKLAGRFGSKTMITAAVVAYMCIVFFAAFFLRAALEFWILAILVGMFQGGIQALSRSYYGKIIPKDHANEYYGFYDIFGKTASIIGTFLVATTTSLTGNASIGVLSIAILLAVALVFLLLQKDPTKGSTEAATVD